MTERQLQFSSALKKLIYDYYVDPLKFEERWHILLEECGISNHVWLGE